MNGRVTTIIQKEEQEFPGIGSRPTFDLLWLASELPWHWWVHLDANVLQWAYNEGQGLLEVTSAILDPVGSNQYLSHPVAVILLKVVCPAPFPPVSTLQMRKPRLREINEISKDTNRN